MSVTRRDLLRYFATTAGCFAVAATGAVGRAGARVRADASLFSFPLGVASADPQSDAVVLWTRVAGGRSTVPLTVQVGADAAFQSIVAQSEVAAEPRFDHTVRVLVTALDPDRYYHYRFIAPDGAVSRTGRTRTAPPQDAERALNIAVFSCQDYEHGFFTAYRRLILDDRQVPAAQRIDFIVHVGDFIYEGIRGPGTEDDPDLNGRPIELYNADGSLRRCAPLPSGGTVAARGWVIPTTLDDYRALYRRYLSDPDLQEARALYPFVQTWDDHELINDYWQSYHNGQSIATLKLAANQAWFEYVPAALSAGGRDVDDHAGRDYEAVPVTDAPAGPFDDHYLSLEPNNLAAIESMTIYRALRWGRMAELLVVDGRSYRGPRGLPQELLTVGRHPYPEAPIEPRLIDILNEGRQALDGNPPETIEYQGQILPNPRRDAPLGSMLGRRQKAWLKRRLLASDARWKLLALNVVLMRCGFDDSFRDGGGVNRILWTDGWDGYPAERRELTAFVRERGIANLVSLTGDRHAHMAGVVLDDYDAPAPAPVAAEFVGCAVSAPCRLVIQKALMAHDPQLAALTAFGGPRHSSEQAILPSLNAWMLHGAAAARALHDGAEPDAALASSDPRVNPHLSYVDTDVYGYFVARFTREHCNVEFVSVVEPVDPSPAVRRRVRFELRSWAQGGHPVLQPAVVEGQAPLGGLRPAPAAAPNDETPRGAVQAETD